jgi:hypothetical protein
MTVCVASQRVLSTIRHCLMADWKEQASVNFCFQVEKTASKTHEALGGFGNNAVGRTLTSVWLSLFKCGETSEYDCSGCPSKARTQNVSLGGGRKADREVIYNLCLNLKPCYKNRVINNCSVTLLETAFIYL